MSAIHTFRKALLALLVVTTFSCEKSEEDAINTMLQGPWEHIRTQYTRYNPDGSLTVTTDETPYVLRYRYDNTVDQIHPATDAGIYNYAVKTGQLVEHKNNKPNTKIMLPSTAKLTFRADTLIIDALDTDDDQRFLFVRPK